MYRIALQTSFSNPRQPAQIQFIHDKGVIFETEDKDVALNRYELELDNYERSKLKLVKVIDVIMNLEALDYCSLCGKDCNCGGTTDPAVGVSNYNRLTNKPKINNITLEDNKNANDLNLQDKMTEYTNEEIDQLLGTQN